MPTVHLQALLHRPRGRIKGFHSMNSCLKFITIICPKNFLFTFFINKLSQNPKQWFFNCLNQICDFSDYYKRIYIMNNTGNKRFTETGRSNYSGKYHVSQSNSSVYKSSDSKKMDSSSFQEQAFQVSVKNLIPITNKIKEQNQFMAEQKQKIEQELAQLNCLSNMLISENQALRQHASQRKIDLKQLICTFVIQNKQDLTDLDHLVYSYKEHNRLLNTQIDSLDKKLSSTKNKNSKMLQNLQQLTVYNVEQQTFLISQKARTQRQQKILKQEKDMMNSVIILESLEKEVADLCVQIGQMKSSNKNILKHVINEKWYLDEEKPVKRQLTVEKIKQKVFMKQKIENIKEKISNGKNALNRVQKIDEEFGMKLRSIYGQSERKKIGIGLMCDKIRKNEEMKQKSKEQIQRLKKQVERRQNIKERLGKQLQNMEYLSQKNEERAKQKKMQAQKQADKAIKGIKQQIQLVDSNLRNELGNTTFKARRQKEKTVSNLKYEVSIIEKRSKELQKTLSGIRDPIKDIKAMEMGLSRVNQ